MAEAFSPRRDESTAALPADSALESLVVYALDQAERLGASGSSARLSVSNGLSAKVRKGEVDTLQQQCGQTFAITVYCDHKTGSASCNQLREDPIRAAVEAACTIAHATGTDPCNGLADPDLLARDPPDLDLYHPAGLSPEVAIDMARECEAAGLAVDSRLQNSEGATVATVEAVSCLGNSHGFLATRRGSRHNVSCVLVAGDDSGMQRDYWYSAARDLDALQSAASVGAEAGRRTLRRLGAAPVATASVPVLFEAPVARGLISHLLSAVSGGSLYRKSSFLLDSIDQPVCAEHLQIQERPHIPGGLGSAAFDREGVATVDRDLVRDGVLRSYLLNSFSARKLGLRSTGHAGGTHNVRVRSDRTLAFEDLLRRLGTGLVVTELMGQGVNLVTGDYSRGAGGYWVVDGEIERPVAGVTVAGNLRDMLIDIDALGSDVDCRGNLQSGSILIRQMTVAGN